MGQGMTPPQRQWRAKNAKGRVRGISFPKWLMQYAIVVYILALAVVSFVYSSYILLWYYMLAGVVSVAAFFIYGNIIAKETSVITLHRGNK